jgi:CBS domain containing-hemolysin-like protein
LTECGVIEEIFGNIQDENDVEVTPIRKIWKNSWNVSPFVRIDEFLEESKLTFEELWLEEEEYDWETLSYLITSLLEWFPNEWEEIEIPLKNTNDEEIWFMKKGEDKNIPERKLIIKVKQVEDNTIWDLRISIV